MVAEAAPARRPAAAGWWRRAALLLGIAIAVPLSAQPVGDREMQVEAAFLVNFVRYAEWPRQRFDGPIYQYEETGTPEVLAQLHSYFDITDALELNASLYHVGEVPFTGIPAYNRADLGLAWRPRDGMELSVWGQNLLDAAHPEGSGAQVPRGVYAQVTLDLGR